MDHKAVTSQLDRHALLMDLAKQVQQHVEKNPTYDEPYAEAEQPNHPPILHHSSR